MSYILDALKKAEQERQRGSVPELLAVQDVIEEKPRSRVSSRYFILPFIAAAAIASVWGLSRLVSVDESLPSPAVHGEGRETAATPVTVSGRTAVPAGGSRTGALSGTVPKPGVNAQALSGGAGPVTTETIKDRSVSGPIVAAADRLSERTGNPEPKQPEIKKSGPSQARAEKPSGVSDPVKSASVRPEEQSRPAAEQRLSPDRIYSLKELPESMKKDLPGFSFSAFLYSENPASRMVRINDRMLKEGQELVPGLRLKEITPDGVIFLHKEVRFLISMKQDPSGR